MRTTTTKVAAYYKLTAAEKIARIKNRIRTICKELMLKHPDAAAWHIGWQEHGIIEKNSKFISVETLENIFKPAMASLVNEFPKLRIMAGTVAVKRTFTEKKDILKQLNLAEEKYAALESVRKIEEIQEDPLQKQVASNLERIQSLKEQPELKELHVVSNTRYDFYKEGDTVRTVKNRKVTPFAETLDKVNQTTNPHTIFRPGGKNTGTRLQTAALPGARDLRISSSICRELTANQRFMEDLEQKQWKRSDLHYVFSDTTALTPGCLYGTYVVRFDSEQEPALICSRQTIDEEKIDCPVAVRLYEHDLPLPYRFLTDRSTAFYPLERRIWYILQVAIKTIPKTHPHHELFLLLDSQFFTMSQTFSFETAEKLFEEYFSIFKSPAFSEATSPSVIKARIMEIIREAKKIPNFPLLNQPEIKPPPGIKKSAARFFDRMDRQSQADSESLTTAMTARQASNSTS